jgi:hypothetical protein
MRERAGMFTLNDITYYEESDIADRIASERSTASEWAVNSLRADNRHETLAIFKAEVSAGTMTDEDAVELFNKIAVACGWETAVASDLITRFRAEVSLLGETVLELDDIEADDEDDAKQKVLDDISFDNIEVRGDLTTLGDSGSFRAGTWDLDDFLMDNLEVEIYEA